MWVWEKSNAPGATQVNTQCYIRRTMQETEDKESIRTCEEGAKERNNQRSNRKDRRCDCKTGSGAWGTLEKARESKPDIETKKMRRETARADHVLENSRRFTSEGVERKGRSWDARKKDKRNIGHVLSVGVAVAKLSVWCVDVCPYRHIRVCPAWTVILWMVKWSRRR